MNIARLLHTVPVSFFILRSASFMVRREGRREWLAEWKAELWQVRHARSESPDGLFHGSEEVTAFCLGAYRDAFWMRRNARCAVSRCAPRLSSAARCGLFLAAWAAASMLLCLGLPGTRRALLPLPYRDAGNLLVVWRGTYSAVGRPTVRLADYQSLKLNKGNLLSDLAFYQPAVERVDLGSRQPTTLSVARASDNLFQLLDLPLPAALSQTGSSSAAKLVLSRTAWLKLFHGDPSVVGRTVEIAGRPVEIAGVLPRDSWRLPGRMDAWMLEDEHGLGNIPANSKGFVIAQMRSTGLPVSWGGWQKLRWFAGGNSQQNSLECISVAQRAQQPFSVFLFTLFLACLALPATTPLPLGDYPVRSDQLPRSIRARRWIFLAVKFALIAPIVYFCSAALAYGFFAPDSSAALYLQLASSFFGFLFAFRWALRDQRKRCPVCLRLLSNPARVGEVSRNFLAWNGTELICIGGHGLLHIPETPTSWFSTQRWLYLDSSWRSLFSDVSIGSAGTI